MTKPVRDMRRNLRLLARDAGEADSPFRIARFAPLRHADAIAAIEPIEPWASLGYPAGWLETYLTRRDTALYRFALLRENESGDVAPAGYMAVRFPWLVGPFLELLAIAPAHQGSGLGAFAVGRLQQAAHRAERQLWTSVALHNPRAARFYERLGFLPTADVPDLLRPGFTERLLRYDARP
ncbi:MAG: GNAT family N-acetyltransferase [Deltaproteobacteria bacterium]|nr:GNAT family N-acetyltransferase [Deltaproteobacteria bacterium]